MIRDWDREDQIPVPKRKLTTGIEPPAYRRDVFKGERRTEWDDWSRILQFDKSLSSAEKKAFHDIFAAEGGMKKAPGGSAVAGILQKTLDTTKSLENTPEILAKYGKNPKTTDLELQDIKEVYKGFFNDAFKGPAQKLNEKNKARAFKGYQILGLIGDDRLSSSIADILFREGTAKGSELIISAIRLTDTDADTGRGNVFGSKTLSALQKIAKNPDQTRNFLEFSANARRGDEKARNDYFRFRDKE
ncbi:MAG: hypothetical protein H6858_01895 [Rhodospirillales bacterium]|nr:hypothetical protein [Rhodospirillales bacterium]